MELLDPILKSAVALIGVLITSFLIPWLKAKASEARSRMKELNASFKDKLLSALQATASEYVVNTMEREYPRIAKLIKEDYEVTRADIKSELHKLGADVYDNLVDTFLKQGIDLLKEFSKEQISEIIRRRVDIDSPFQKRETSESFMKPGVASKILEDGLEFEWGELEITVDEDEADVTDDDD